MVAVRRALISVSDKTGVVDFARALVARGVEILSTGGTKTALSEAGLLARDITIRQAERPEESPHNLPERLSLGVASKDWRPIDRACRAVAPGLSQNYCPLYRRQGAIRQK